MNENRISFEKLDFLIRRARHTITEAFAHFIRSIQDSRQMDQPATTMNVAEEGKIFGPLIIDAGVVQAFVTLDE